MCICLTEKNSGGIALASDLFPRSALQMSKKKPNCIQPCDFVMCFMAEQFGTKMKFDRQLSRGVHCLFGSVLLLRYVPTAAAPIPSHSGRATIESSKSKDLRSPSGLSLLWEPPRCLHKLRPKTWEFGINEIRTNSIPLLHVMNKSLMMEFTNSRSKSCEFLLLLFRTARSRRQNLQPNLTTHNCSLASFEMQLP